MTAEILKQRFENNFVPEACDYCQKQGLLENCKILILLDNCTAHTASGVVEKDVVMHLFSLQLQNTYPADG